VPRRRLLLTIALTGATLAASSAFGQPRGPAQELAEKVCRFGTMTQNDRVFEPLGLDAPLMIVVDPMDTAIAVSAATCNGMAARANGPFLGLHHLVEAAAPRESAFRDYFILSPSGELIDGIRHDLTQQLVIRIDVTEPGWRDQIRALESFWLSRYGMQSR